MCDHHLFNEPTGLQCTCVGVHQTHVYVASAGCDVDGGHS